MPQKIGFIKNKIGFIKNINYDYKQQTFLKLTKEIDALKNSSYELLYDCLNLIYGFYFELDNRIYYIEIPYKLVDGDNKNLEIKLCEWKGYYYQMLDEKDLGEEIYNLCMEMPEIIKKHSTDRIKFLFNEIKK